MTNIIPFRSSSNPEHVLEEAKGEYSELLVLGWDKEECLSISGTSGLKTQSEVLWLLEKFKFSIINGDYDDD